jgi:hypothetical protein
MVARSRRLAQSAPPPSRATRPRRRCVPSPRGAGARQRHSTSGRFPRERPKGRESDPSHREAETRVHRLRKRTGGVDPILLASVAPGGQRPAESGSSNDSRCPSRSARGVRFQDVSAWPRKTHRPYSKPPKGQRSGPTAEETFERPCTQSVPLALLTPLLSERLVGVRLLEFQTFSLRSFDVAVGARLNVVLVWIGGRSIVLPVSKSSTVTS